MFLAVWSVVNFLLIWEAELEVQFGPGLGVGQLLAFTSIAFLTGAGAGGLMSLRTRPLKGSRSPSGVVLGTVALVLGILILIACFGLTWFAVGMLATG
jgi:hypothetical protein